MRLSNDREFAFRRTLVRGRKTKQESRAAEFRQRLLEWKQTPVVLRPSLRALAREIGTSHQLLSHYLSALEEWRREKELEPLRTQAKAKNLILTMGDELRYLAWLRKVEVRQARGAARAAKWASKHIELLERIKQLLPDSWNDFDR